jgi:phosphoribosylformylglycinamidine cyclo-ligase
MRHPGAFTYYVTELPPVPPVLQFMVERAQLGEHEAYGSLNMGAGFAVFVPEQDADKTVAVAEQTGIKAYKAGTVAAGTKRIVIDPLDVVFEGKSLDLRA